MAIFGELLQLYRYWCAAGTYITYPHESRWIDQCVSKRQVPRVDWSTLSYAGTEIPTLAIGTTVYYE